MRVWGLKLALYRGSGTNERSGSAGLVLCAYSSSGPHNSWARNLGRVSSGKRFSDGLEKQIKCVVGIENKLEAMEQEEQVSHYQNEIANKYVGIPKIVVFLSPDGRAAQTGSVHLKCPFVSCSYSSVVKMCDAIPKSGGQVSDLISNLRSHMEGKQNMVNEAQSRIKELYQDESHRKAIRLICEFAPTIKTVVDYIEKTSKGEIRFDYPKKSTKTDLGIWFEIGALNSLIRDQKSLGIYYVILPDSTLLDIDEKCSVCVIAWCKGDQRTSEAQNLRNANLPKSVGSISKKRKGWEVLWIGGTYSFQDLGEKDGEALTKLLGEARRATYEPLKSFLETNGGKCK